MSSDPKERWYDVILSPVVTEKTTGGSEHNQVTFKVRNEARNQGSRGRAV